ncbi:hypothetical protein JRO89_XS15G0078800 [Xanthoceras sorbifolium]|uniref:Uncharacterized protein n=1 Tax=Xanthoceras sorbifolium TaxID=99658 RepID=A0ABQ8H1A3_9ROSI|nr:hypothetical protein JRO89_XS15G0078800 [Xanthoceras sorbifolium]
MALLMGGFMMPKTMLQLPNFKPCKQRSGNMIISCAKPPRPAGSSGRPPQINTRDLASTKTEKQLDNSKTIKVNDDSSKKSESSG